MIERARRRNPAHRFKELAEVADVLHTVRLSLEDEPANRRRRGPPRRGRRRARTVAATVPVAVAAPSKKPGAPSALEFADEPATVKVSIHANPQRPTPQPSIVERDPAASLPPRAVVEKASAKGRSGGGGAMALEDRALSTARAISAST